MLSLFSVSVEPFSTSIRCLKNKEFHWLNERAVGLDIVFSYRCGTGKAFSVLYYSLYKYMAKLTVAQIAYQ